MTTLRLASTLLLLALLSAGAEGAAPKRVLILHSFGRDFAPDYGTAVALRADLTQLLRQPVALQEASLDVERGGGPEDEGSLVEYLLRRNLDAPPDLVIAISAPAMFFALRHRDALFPDRPLLVSGVDRRWFESTRIGARDRVVTLGARDRAVTMRLDFLATARNALELLPDSTTIALVMGTSRLEQVWAKDIQLELAPLGDRVRVLPPGALSLEQMRQRVAALPPNSAVVYGMFAVGTDGAQHENELALVAISGASSAPVFGIYASLGLASMRERVRLLQGELDIESTPGRGTTVVAWVPA